MAAVPWAHPRPASTGPDLPSGQPRAHVSSPDSPSSPNGEHDQGSHRPISACSGGTCTFGDVVTHLPEGSCPRPTAPPAGFPGRPLTRRMREAQQVQQAEAAKAQAARGRKVTYVDHHHVHHHHHFHGPSDWGGPGDVPPEAERQSLEVSAEADAERARAASSGSPRKTARAHVYAGGGRTRPVGGGRGGHGVPGVRDATAESSKPSSALRAAGFDANVDFNAEALFSRDGFWPSSSSVRTGTACSTIAPTAAKQMLPLSEYLRLVSQLAPETRLKFSPYGVPRTARVALGAPSCMTQTTSPGSRGSAILATAR